jgi:hypothetical protein
MVGIMDPILKKLLTDNLKHFFKYSSWTTIIIAFAVWPLPGIKDNPTGFQYFHNHAEKYILINREAIYNNRDTFSHGFQKVSSEWNVYLLEGLILQTRDSINIEPEVKESILRIYEDDLKRKKEDVKKEMELIDQLNTEFSGYGLASKRRKEANFN